MNIPFIVADCETTGLDWKTDRLHGVAFAWGPGVEECAYINPRDLFHSGFIDYLESTPVVGHNVRFDLKFINKETGALPLEFHDTRLLAHLLDENNSVGLKELVPRYLGENLLSAKDSMDAVCSKAGVSNIAQLCALDLDGNEQWPVGSFTEIIAKYACEDARNTYSLFQLLSTLVDKDEGLSEYYLTEAQPFERIMLDMEIRGISVNSSVFDTYGEELRIRQADLETHMTAIVAAEINEIEDGLYEKAQSKRKSQKGKDRIARRNDQYSTRFLFSSGAHIGKLIYGCLGASIRTTAKGALDTSEATLQAIQKETQNSKLYAFLDLFFEWRSVQKNLSTYVNGLKETIHEGRIHSSYGQYTTTGRTHSSEPNMQNLPRGSVVKRAFVPAPGNCFVYFDYSQIELRIAAHLSGDEQMLQQFNLGIDPHKETARAIFGECGNDEQRQVGKTCNFLLIYDGSPNRLHQELGERFTLEECKEFKRLYFEMYSGYKSYLNEQLKQVRETQILRSGTGRVRRVPDITFGDYLDWRRRLFTGSAQLMEALRSYPSEHLSQEMIFDRASKRYSHAKKQAYNFPVQHLGAHIMKYALLGLAAAGYDVVATVHDSGAVEIPIARLGEVDRIRDIVETAAVLDVPLKADIKILNSLDETNLFSLS